MSSAKPSLMQKLLVSLFAGLAVSPAALAATVVVQNVNQPGEGFNDPTPATPVAGNPGTTLGEQRLNAFQAAADEWAAMLVSNVTIVVEAQMDPDLFCDAVSATLGSAGPTTAHGNFPNYPVFNTWYPAALANSLANSDLNGGTPDIRANFNPDIGTPGCLEFSDGWSYEITSGVPTSGLSFYNTVIHEIGHGVGFLTFADGNSGALFNGFPDHYAQFLYSEDEASRWPSLSNAQRAASALSVNGLTWDGPEVASVDQLLNTGRNASGRVQIYAPNPFRGGSSVSHFDTTLSPNEIMEPFLTTVNEKRLTNHLMLDIGWITMLELDVSITDGRNTRQAGLSNSYTVTLDNNGPADLTIVDALVTNTQPAAFLGASWTCSGSGDAVCSSSAGSGNISSNVTIPLGGRITFQVNGTISGAFSGELVNTVSVTMPANITNTTLSTDSDSTTVSAGPGITVTPISNITTEAGGTASFSVVLNTAPSSSITIPLSSNDPGEGVVQSNVQFTNVDWNAPKVITVTGVNDNVDDGNQVYTIVTGAAQSGDGDYNGLNPPDVAMTNIDDDQAGIQVSAISGNTSEAGGTATFGVVLSSEPTANVTIGLVSSDAGEGAPDVSSLLFTPGNWSSIQTVTVTGINDDVVDGDVPYSINLAAASSADGNYTGLTGSAVNVVNLDNDTAGVSVSAISGDTTEAGGTASFTITLNSEPIGTVTVNLSSTNPAEGTVGPSSFDFNAGNWNSAQQITVTGVDDDINDGDQDFAIQIGITSADGNYGGLAVEDVSVRNVDDDTAGFTVSAISGNTTEAGGSANFTVVLNSEPLADVSTNLSSSDTEEGTVSLSTLTFTPENWNVAQQVTVTGVDDDVADGDQDYTVFTAAAVSADETYSGLDPNDVSVSNEDDDTAGVTVAPAKGNTTEAGGSTDFSLVLLSKPTSDVTIGLASSDPGEGVPPEPNIVFTAENWDVEVIIPVDGVDDDIDDGDQDYTIVTTASSSDSMYDGIAVDDVDVTNEDDDTAGISVSPISGDTTEAGGTATFSVVLDSEPLADVVIGLSSTNTDEGTVSVSSLTFTAGNWDQPQQVTVAGVDDLVVDGDVAYTITTAPASSSDPGYNGFNAADVSVLNLDDDVLPELMFKDGFEGPVP